MTKGLSLVYFSAVLNETWGKVVPWPLVPQCKQCRMSRAVEKVSKFIARRWLRSHHRCRDKTKRDNTTKQSRFAFLHPTRQVSILSPSRHEYVPTAPFNSNSWRTSTDKCSRYGRRKDFFQGGGAVGDFPNIFSRWGGQKWWNLIFTPRNWKNIFLLIISKPRGALPPLPTPMVPGPARR